jgi:hypothetical protein
MESPWVKSGKAMLFGPARSGAYRSDKAANAKKKGFGVGVIAKVNLDQEITDFDQ